MKSQRKSLFVSGGAQGPGRGPRKGAPNAGRPPDWLVTLKRQAAGEAVNQVVALLKAKKLSADQLIRIGKDFDPDSSEPHAQHDITIVVTTGTSELDTSHDGVR